MTHDPFEEKNFNLSNLYKVRLDSVPVIDDAAFWERERRIPLQTTEEELLNKYYLQQSEKNRKELKNDSLIFVNAKNYLIKHQEFKKVGIYFSNDEEVDTLNIID